MAERPDENDQPMRPADEEPAAAGDHPTTDADDEDEYGDVPTPEHPYAPGGEDEPPPDERDD